jgi:4a-hydroxytetrahydrobiopterin dehydratase
MRDPHVRAIICDNELHPAKNSRNRFASASVRITPARPLPVQSIQPDETRRANPMTDLASKTCVPCRGGVPPLAGAELDGLAKQTPQWTVVDNHHITRSFSFPDFARALAFVNRVAAIAEEQGHHPDIFLTWGKAEVTTWTHKINGLTESDFILAAKIDKL